MSAMASAASSSMALGAAPVISVALTRLFSEKISRSVMFYTPFKGSVSDRARFYVSGENHHGLADFAAFADGVRRAGGFAVPKAMTRSAFSMISRLRRSGAPLPYRA